MIYYTYEHRIQKYMSFTLFFVIAVVEQFIAYIVLIIYRILVSKYLSNLSMLFDQKKLGI